MDGGGESLSIVDGWQETPEARSYINQLLIRNKRILFGILERPALEQLGSGSTFKKRLFLVGKSGVGKSSTVAKLCGRDISSSHDETLGIQTTTIYWPAKIASSRKVIVLELELWDSGERAMNKFDHILSACQEATDGYVFFFSYADRHSWEDLPHLIARTTGRKDSTLKMVVGTHADSVQREVTEAEIEQFQNTTKLITLPITNINSPRLADRRTPDGRAGVMEIAPFMNALTQILLVHDWNRGLLPSSLVTPSADSESPSQ
ncbi:hypothetical protein EMCRGX_G016013 [Ephydatia muelleri]